MEDERDKGKEAYENDVLMTPSYHTGQRRPTWEQLPETAHEAWRQKAEEQ